MAEKSRRSAIIQKAPVKCASHTDFLLKNAREAEKWLVKAAKAYPERCDSNGKVIETI